MTRQQIEADLAHVEARWSFFASQYEGLRRLCDETCEQAEFFAAQIKALRERLERLERLEEMDEEEK